MAAPKGNQNAAKPGQSELFRIRFADPADIGYAKDMTPEELGIAVLGYMLWQESPESDDSSFITWIKQHTDYGQYNRPSHVAAMEE